AAAAHDVHVPARPDAPVHRVEGVERQRTFRVRGKRAKRFSAHAAAAVRRCPGAFAALHRIGATAARDARRQCETQQRGTRGPACCREALPARTLPIRPLAPTTARSAGSGHDRAPYGPRSRPRPGERAPSGRGGRRGRKPAREGGIMLRPTHAIIAMLALAALAACAEPTAPVRRTDAPDRPQFAAAGGKFEFQDVTFPDETTGIIEAGTKATRKGTFTQCSYFAP